MTKEELRMKCVECAALKAVDPNDIMARAKLFHSWVTENQDEKMPEVEIPVKRVDPSKMAGNSKILP